MRSLSRVLLESIVVGIIILLLSVLVYPIVSGKMLTLDTPALKEMLLGSFLIGFIGHVLLEVLGANEQFCKTAGY